MVFSSIFFIFGFLPIFMLLYYLVPRKLQNPVLIIGSLFFYAWGEPVYVVLMLFSAVFNYFMGLDLEASVFDQKARKRSLIFAVIINLFILRFFKYNKELPLPIGISFYTFKNLSYIFDVYMGKIEAQKNIVTFGVYSTMFPHMAAGPIVRYADIEKQLVRRPVSLAKFGIGAEYFIKGLAKKVLLADNLAAVYGEINALGSSASMLTAWLGIILYTLQIYLDFSGYSDMAIGLGKMLGFDFQKNFDYPYTSLNVSEFWRRWHISLGSWFRDYIYIPLGGNRVSTGKHIRNILIVWALTGIWHGASWNFVLWGLYYGLLLLLEKFLLKDILERVPPFVCRIYTMLSVMIGWGFFSQTTFSGIGSTFGTLLGFGASAFADTAFLYYLKTTFVLLIISILSCSSGLQTRFKRMMKRKPKTAIVINLLLFVLATAYMVYNSYTPFLYLKF